MPDGTWRFASSTLTTVSALPAARRSNILRPGLQHCATKLTCKTRGRLPMTLHNICARTIHSMVGICMTAQQEISTHIKETQRLVSTGSASLAVATHLDLDLCCTGRCTRSRLYLLSSAALSMNQLEPALPQHSPHTGHKSPKHFSAYNS